MAQINKCQSANPKSCRDIRCLSIGNEQLRLSIGPPRRRRSSSHRQVYICPGCRGSPRYGTAIRRLGLSSESTPAIDCPGRDEPESDRRLDGIQLRITTIHENAGVKSSIPGSALSSQQPRQLRKATAHPPDAASNPTTRETPCVLYP